MRLALYNPEIPQNTGTLLRLGACLGIELDIIEPCGFVLSDRRMQRAGMDYLEFSNYKSHKNWETFKNVSNKNRLVLITTNAQINYVDFEFSLNDILVLGTESSGFPESIEAEQSYQVKIPMVEERRSINIATAAAMVLGEGLRQTGRFPN